LILGACALIAAIWLIRGRSGGTGSPPSEPVVEAPTRLTVVPLEPPPTQLPQIPANPSASGPAAINAPDSSPSMVETNRRAEPPANQAAGTATSSSTGQLGSVAPPSMQPVPRWQERATHGAARQEVVPPINLINTANPSDRAIANPSDRAVTIPPAMSPLWPQDLRRGQVNQGPNIQRNQFVDQNPPSAPAAGGVDDQIEWAAPFAPGRGTTDSVRTSDRRSEPAGARFEGTIQVSPPPRDYDGRSGSFVH
jgi:hypothetical protein